MQTIRSTDGTPIAYQRSGQGSPLILVHGTTADHTRWAPILPNFEQHFTAYAIDRRGRGESGDAEQYTIEQEFEDIVAVINSIDMNRSSFWDTRTGRSVPLKQRAALPM